MKIAVSVPDPVFEATDSLAKKLNVSRSELVTRALKKLIASFDDELTRQQLDAVYESEDSRLDADVNVSQLDVIAEDAW